MVQAFVDPTLEFRRPLTHLVKQVDRVDEIRMLGLPEAVYRTYEQTGFVDAWMTNNNVNPAILNEFRSGMKLDELVRRNAIAVGDELYLPGQAGLVATVSYPIYSESEKTSLTNGNPRSRQSRPRKKSRST